MQLSLELSQEHIFEVGESDLQQGAALLLSQYLDRLFVSMLA